MFVLFFNLLLHSSPSPVLTSTSTGFTSEQSCNAAAARLAKKLKPAYGEHLPRLTTVCVAK